MIIPWETLYGTDNMENKKWKWVAGYDGLYAVSDKGDVLSFNKNKNGKLLAQHTEKLNHTSYKQVSLVKDKIKKTVRVHTIVAQAFLLKHEDDNVVNHIDNNGLNNSVENLEWGTQKDNIQHSIKQNRSGDSWKVAHEKRRKRTDKKRKEAVGKVFGKWTILKALPRETGDGNPSYMLCKCICGSIQKVRMSGLKNGQSKQCKKCVNRKYK